MANIPIRPMTDGERKAVADLKNWTGAMIIFKSYPASEIHSPSKVRDRSSVMCGRIGMTTE